MRLSKPAEGSGSSDPPGVNGGGQTPRSARGPSATASPPGRCPGTCFVKSSMAAVTPPARGGWAGWGSASGTEHGQREMSLSAVTEKRARSSSKANWWLHPHVLRQQKKGPGQGRPGCSFLRRPRRTSGGRRCPRALGPAGGHGCAGRAPGRDTGEVGKSRRDGVNLEWADGAGALQKGGSDGDVPAGCGQSSPRGRRGGGTPCPGACQLFSIHQQKGAGKGRLCCALCVRLRQAWRRGAQICKGKRKTEKKKKKKKTPNPSHFSCNEWGPHTAARDGSHSWTQFTTTAGWKRRAQGVPSENRLGMAMTLRDTALLPRHVGPGGGKPIFLLLQLPGPGRLFGFSFGVLPVVCTEAILRLERHFQTPYCSLDLPGRVLLI